MTPTTCPTTPRRSTCGVELSRHGGDCTFETFVKTYDLDDPVLWELARVVAEADLEDEHDHAPEACGLDVLIREGLYELRKRAYSAANRRNAERDQWVQSPRKEPDMKWVTRERPKTDRIACPWLIKNFIDPEAEFLYVPSGDVLAVAEREGAHSYDAPGAEFTHRDGLCSFEVLVEEYKLDDPAIGLLALIVHGADIADDRDATPQSLGLLAVAEGFHLLELGDHRQLELSLPVYDALYAWCKAEVAGTGAA